MSIEEIMAQSPTPRTHSIWNALVNAGSNPVETGRILGAARKMELELKAANERIQRLEAVVNDPHALWTNWLRGDVKLPAGIGDVRQYQDRIKRLEEAGDKMADLLDGGVFMKLAVQWHEAKEVKP